MRETKATGNGALLTNERGLAELLGTGLATARKVGADSGAVVRIGKLKRYNVAKVQEYLDRIAE